MKIPLLFGLLLLTGCAHEISESRPLALDARSINLTSDIKEMWKTEPLKKGGAERVSTQAAVDAADRVFSSVQLVGMTEAQVFALLGNPALANKSNYHGSTFLHAPPNAMVYRFDTGFNGWEFQVILNGASVVQKVRRFQID